MARDWSPPPGRRLDDGRLHLNHGPIDLIIDAAGPDRDACLAGAERRFQSVLTGLVSELPGLRAAASTARRFDDPIAEAMRGAAAKHAAQFVTPMAAVAGAVADAVLAASVEGLALEKAYVNNGGDVAFYVSHGQSIAAAIAQAQTTLTIRAEDPVRGVATSGWRGRSLSLGVADAVTVLAADAAAADVAATLIANAVDLPGHPAIERRPARALSPDSDLGDRLATVAVGALSSEDVEAALARGLARAADMRRRGLIVDAFLALGGARSVLSAGGAVDRGGAAQRSFSAQS